MLTVINNSITFSLLFASVLLLKKLLGKHLSARLHYTIWVAVVVSLLIPVRIESSFSLWNLLPKQAAESVVQLTNDLQPQNETVSGIDPDSGEISPSHGQTAAATGSPAAPTVSYHTEPAQADPVYPVARIDRLTLLRAVWLAGAAAAFIWQFAGGLWLRKHIIRSGCKTLSWIETGAEECRKALNIRRNIRVVLQPVLPTPAVIGIFHPILAMPESVVDEGNGNRVRHILMHEFNHVRRGDLFIIAFLNLLCSIYWFNPITWFCFSRIRRDMEASCDNDAVNALGENLRQDYIRTLVYFSGMGRRSRAQAVLSLHGAGIKMKKRIGAMFMTKKTKPAIAVPVIILVLVLLIAVSAMGCLPVSGSGTAFAGLSAAADPDNSSSTSDTGTADPQAAGQQTPETGASNVESGTASQAPDETTETPAPAESQWENIYKPVLDEYREFAASISQNDGSGDFSDMSDPWGRIAPDIMMSSRNFGYAFRDMDSNGIPELFLLTSDGSVWAMYTFVDGAPKLLGTFWPRNLCVLDRSDLIYINWSNGAFDNGRDAYSISKDGRELELILRVAMESADETGNPLDEPRYYKCVGSESDKRIISAEEADAETSKFPENNDNSGLDFIPLGQ